MARVAVHVSDTRLLCLFVRNNYVAYPVNFCWGYQADVDKQISELLRLGFIEPSVSPQVSPLVCVRKPKYKDGNRAIRTCVDYRYVNKFPKNSASILEDISTIIQEVGKAHYISKFDANSGYHQCPVKDTDRWLTAFVHGTSVYQWCRTPFGIKTSGDTRMYAVYGVYCNPFANSRSRTSMKRQCIRTHGPNI
jgi:hypothetical protein